MPTEPHSRGVRSLRYPVRHGRIGCEFGPWDPDLIRDAFAHGRAANLIHLGTGWKFDLFPVQDDEYSVVQLARRSKREIRSSAEDAARVCCQLSGRHDPEEAGVVQTRGRNLGTTMGGCSRDLPREWVIARHPSP
jgi:hypothetical protein